MSDPTTAQPIELTTSPAPQVRTWLAAVADVLIPASDDMPSASEVDVQGRQLDIVLGARPDLTAAVVRAHELAGDSTPEAVLDLLAGSDPEALDAVRMVVAGGYYIHPDVRSRLGYTGQEPRQVRVDVVPDYIEDGLLERVMERGPIFRNDEPTS
ncbi:hypothetical protein [Nocardioides sp. GXZ039]|uniref:hypothetical protein n=1 Tax=Nocardioides sp. GXZ039 TaxID=3136018 RepID=UPI0030F3DE52